MMKYRKYLSQKGGRFEMEVDYKGHPITLDVSYYAHLSHNPEEGPDLVCIEHARDKTHRNVYRRLDCQTQAEIREEAFKHVLGLLEES